MIRTVRGLGAAIAAACLAGTAAAQAVPAGSLYVAMGSSYAAGPGVGQAADTPPNRCDRSTDNYARQLARKRDLRLVDVSCGGATTAHILDPWGELPPQIAAVTPDARLVTVTIGGNDVGYVGALLAGSCTGSLAQPPALCRYFDSHDPQAAARTAQLLAPPADAVWAKAEAGLEQIAREVRRRAPQARLIFVDYLTVLPDHGSCAEAPLSPEAADQIRGRAARLAQLTAAVAARNGAEVLRASALSRGHDACASEPWMAGVIQPPGAPRFAPYHPTLAGMTAIAEALDRRLGR